MIKHNQELRNILETLLDDVLNDFPEAVLAEEEEYEDLLEVCTKEEMNAFDDYFAIMKLLNRMEGFK
jgi:hypothetical protein